MTNTPNLDLSVNARYGPIADAVDLALGERRARGLGRIVRAGAMVSIATDLAGCGPFDRARSWFPAQQEGPSRFAPTPIVIPATRGVDSFKDISPRFGMAYDVFGNGRTALKFTPGKYLEGVGTMSVYANTNPSLRMPQTTSTFGTAGVTRAWIDANSNLAPDCDLQNPDVQDLRSTGGDLCGVMSNTRFGRTC